MTRSITGASVVAGVVGSPVAHSLSPVIHNAWIAAAGIDAVYVPFSPPPGAFSAFIEGLRGRAICGLNVTLPFKEVGLKLADRTTERASQAGAANILLFNSDGTIGADNVDGLGLLGALAAQAPGFDPKKGPAVVLGAGGAARGAVASLLAAGAPLVRVVNRTLSRAEEIADSAGAATCAFALDQALRAFDGANVVINATSAGLASREALDLPLDATPTDCVVMDMTYRPLITPFLAQAQRLGRQTVDGLEMLVRQAEPSFEALFGRCAPPDTDVRGLCLTALEAEG